MSTRTYFGSVSSSSNNSTEVNSKEAVRIRLVTRIVKHSGSGPMSYQLVTASEFQIGFSDETDPISLVGEVPKSWPLDAPITSPLPWSPGGFYILVAVVFFPSFCFFFKDERLRARTKIISRRGGGDELSDSAELATRSLIRQLLGGPEGLFISVAFSQSKLIFFCWLPLYERINRHRLSALCDYDSIWWISGRKYLSRIQA